MAGQPRRRARRQPEPPASGCCSRTSPPRPRPGHPAGSAVWPRRLTARGWPRGRGPGAGGGGHRPRPGSRPFRRARAVRQTPAGLLRRDVKAPTEASRRAVFDIDLDEACLWAEVRFGGPLLARAVLDLVAADSAAGLPLAEQTGRGSRWMRTCTRVCSPRTRPPPAPAPRARGSGGTWLAEATERLLASRPNGGRRRTRLRPPTRSTRPGPPEGDRPAPRHLTALMPHTRRPRLLRQRLHARGTGCGLFFAMVGDADQDAAAFSRPPDSS